MRILDHGWFGAAAVWTALAVAIAGCGKSTDPAPATVSGKAATTPVVDRYANVQEDSQEPPFAHVKLPEITQQPIPFVVLHTTQGDIKLRLDVERAPRTVYNFISYINAGHYNNTIFHQVERGYALLGGGFTEDLQEKPARYPIPSEAANGLKNRRGTIAMARRPDDPDSATCQFIINLGDNPGLDYQGPEPDKYGYCVFGEVIEGLETLERIAAVEVRDAESFPRLPVTPVKIQSVQTMNQRELVARSQQPAAGPIGITR